MRRLLLIAFLLLQSAFASTVIAAPCVSAPLGTYTAGGFSCTIGSLDFSNFTLVATIGDPFASLTIAPVTTAPNEFGLQFTVDQTAATGELFEQLIGYRVTGIGSVINRNTVFLTGSSTTGEAAVSALEQKCLGGTFAGLDGVSGCTGTALNLAVTDTAVLDFLSEFADLSPSVPFLSVVMDIGVDGGPPPLPPDPEGTGQLTSATNLFRVVPTQAAVVDEPASAALAVLALLIMATRRRTRASLPRS